MEKEVKPLYIKISPTVPMLPITLDADLTEEQEQALLATCPTIHLSATTSHQEITEFLIDLFAYYFELPKEKINAQSDLVDDIERQVWARELGVSFEEVAYGRIFCSTDEQGNAVGGMEDRGIMIATMFMMDFSALAGIKEVGSAADATFEARDDEFGSYYDCKTIANLADLIYSVCKKLK
ncbi:ImmA/IrrE family metallo-endopeptidase [Vibrio alginolyticus]|nr:ImmA/IrrE family metallo-endopeptidase [Vibrio alginolyticus]